MCFEFFAGIVIVFAISGGIAVIVFAKILAVGFAYVRVLGREYRVELAAYIDSSEACLREAKCCSN